MAQELDTEQPDTELMDESRVERQQSQAGPGPQSQSAHEPEPPPVRARSVWREHPGRIVVGIIVLIGVIVGGVFWWIYASTYETTDDAQIDGHIYPVSARVSGRVLAVKVDSNQQVQE